MSLSKTGNCKSDQEDCSSVQSPSCVPLCEPMDCSSPGFPVHHQLLEPTQTHVHYVYDAIQPSHPLLSPSPPTFNLSQHQGLFQWVSSSHQVAKVLELQLQYQSFQWILRVDFLYDWVYMISFRMSLYAGYIFSGNFPTLLRTFYSHEIIYVTYNSRLEVM